MGFRDNLRLMLGMGVAPMYDQDARQVELLAFEPGIMPFGGATPANLTTPGASTFGVSGPPPAVPDYPPGRVSWDNAWQLMGSGAYVILPPDEAIEAWRTLDLDGRSIRRMSAARLLRVLADASPDVSRALWDFLRLCNPGWQAVAYKPDSSTREQHKKGQKLVDAFVDRMNDKYGSMDVLIGKLHFSAFLYGMMLAELVLDEDGRTAVDFVTPDPMSIRFEQYIDPVYGPQWIIGQYQLGRFVEIGRYPTVRYVAIDPPPGQAPYGRSPSAPALFSSLFLLGLLQDLRRVVSQQGYPRYDLAINLQKLREEMANSLDAAQPGAFKAWVNQTVAEVQAAYVNLPPDAAFIHTDVVTVNRPTGAVSADVLAAVDSLVKELERQITRALKTMPLLMGTEGASEANANRQWEIFARGVVSVQSLSAAIWSRLLTLLCQAEGVACRVEMEFSTLRASEEFRDAQTDAQKIQNALAKWRAGWISQEEASMEVTGHPPDQPEPREEPATERPTAPDVPPTAATPPSGAVTPGTGSAPDNPEVADGKQPDEGRWVPVWVRDFASRASRRQWIRVGDRQNNATSSTLNNVPAVEPHRVYLSPEPGANGRVNGHNGTSSDRRERVSR